MLVHNVIRWRSLGALACMAMALTACGGGDGDADLGPAPSFAGNYNAVYTLSVDDCATGVASSAATAQSVSQDGRTVAMRSNTMNLRGQVNADNLGFQVTNASTESGVNLTATVVYKNTANAGVYATSFTLVASAQGQSCTVVYNGTATLQP